MSFKIESKDNFFNSITPVSIKLQFSKQKLFNSSFTTQEQAISNLKNLLLTRKGERYHLPNFGSDLLYVLFQPITDQLISQVQSTINQAVERWLPYINIERIVVDTSSESQFEIKVTINFSIQNIEAEQTIELFASEDGTLQVVEG